MRTTIGDWDSGQITLDERDETLAISIHWPFDRETDEWIDLSTRIPLFIVSGAVIDPRAGFELKSGPDFLKATPRGDQYLLSVQGHNTVSPVYLDCRVDSAAFLQIVDHLRSLGARG